jgi:hypothetical protein
MTSLRARIDQIEALVHEDVGRNVNALFAYATGGLWNAATTLTSVPHPRVGLITGFYIPAADPPCAETDGPLGVALLARGLTKVGASCRLATDDLCVPACAAALEGAGVRGVAVDAVAPEAPLQELVGDWRRAALTHAVSVERCGRCADGSKRDMRGTDISPYTADLDALFIAGPWETVAVGDGGNEIGMGSVPRHLIADNVPNGDAIACVTPADHLVAAGVSNWGAYALVAALALLREDWRDAMLECLAPSVHYAALDTMVNRGPAVDGVFLKQSMTVDSISLARHEEKLAAIRAVIERG